jgi:hypothetical protein
MPITGYISFGLPIGPNVETDPVFITDPKYGLGGLRTVAGITERQDIVNARRQVGMIVYETISGKYYNLVGGIDNSNWQEIVGLSSGISGLGYLPLASASQTGVASFGNQFVVSAAGAVSLTSNYVISINGSTGTITGMATTGSNTFAGLQTMSAGLTANHLYVSNGATFANGLVVSSGSIAGTLSTASQTNITAVGTLTRLDVGSGGISSAGGITGTLLTASQPNITAVGTLTRLDVGSGGISSAGGITGTLLTASQTNITAVGTLTRLDVGSGGIVSSGGITGTLNTASQPNITAVGVLTALNVTGALAVTGTSRFVGNSTFANGINVTNGITGTLNTASQPNVTAVGVLTSLDVTGSMNVTGNSTFRNGINVTNGITGTLLTASQPNVTTVGTLTRLDVGSGGISSSGGITGTLLTASQPNVTAVGVLTALNVTGALAVTGTSRFVGNSTFANGINVTNGITGTLLTASQPNVTAVGVLTSLDVTGSMNVTGNAIFRNGINVTNGITGTLLTASQTNITAVGVLTSLDVTGSMNVTGNAIFRNGINVTNGITGTLLTASQTNITAVGTLTRLDVGSGGISSAGGITGTLLTASQPNITLVGTLTSLSSSGLMTASGGLTANHLYVSNGATFARGISVTGGTAYFNNDISVSGNHPGLPSYIYESNSGITFPGSSVTAFTIGDKWTNGSDEYTWIGNAWIQVDNVVSSGTNPANDMSNVAYRNVAQTFTAKQDFARGISATHVNIDSGLTVGFNARTTLLGDVEINQDSSKNLQINASTVNIKNNLVIGSSSSTLSSPSTAVYFGTGVPSLELRGNGNAGSGTLGYCGALQFVSSPASSPTIPVGGSGAAYIWAENGILRFGTGATAGGWRTRCRMTDTVFTVDSGNLKVGMLPTQTSTTTFNGVELNETGVITINQRSATTSFVDVIQFYRGMTAGVDSNKVGQIKASTSAVAYETTSDYRLKQDIQPMIGGLEKVKLLKPCTYVWKNTGETAQGFIAHEVQEIIHDVVSGAKDEVDEHGNPKYQGIDQSKLVATLTNAIQELNALVEAQQVEINNLKNRLM